jgi:hypothetical protein
MLHEYGSLSGFKYFFLRDLYAWLWEKYNSFIPS